MERITVHIYADLRQYVDGNASAELDLLAHDTVRAVMQRLGIPESRTRIIFVNNRHADIDQSLCAGDRVDLFSAIGGG